MAGMDLDTQRAGTLPGGLRIECGEITHTDQDGTVFIPTGFTKLLGGMAVSDLTDHCVGHAVSICEGPTIQMAMTDFTGNSTIDYIAFGW